MVTNALEEMALSYHRNTEEQDDICEKHKIQLIKILRTNDVLCRLCESERIHSENQIKVNKLVDAEHERERKFYLERFSLYDDVLKNATLDNFDTPTEKETEKLKFAKKICREWASGARNNVVFQGEAGTGKSHLAFAMMKALSETTKEIAIFTESAQLNKKLRQTFAIGLPTILILFNVSTVAILWLGGYNVSMGSLQVGDIMAVIEYANLILLSMLMAIFVIIDIPEAIVCYSRIRELLEHENTDTFPEPYNSNSINLNSHSTKYSTNQEESQNFAVTANDDTPLLEFRNVTFRYDNAESPALENISFVVHHGETLAIMGDIGSGKSTITNLIPRLFSIESGDILFKGTSIYEWNIDDLRARIGYVPQRAYLFTGTVDMNVRYGSAPNQDITAQDVENACRLSKADEFISRLEGGYQYMVAQGGTNLSGGQRQRLAMARALVRKPDLFIFDDSFSALDGTTERAVRTALHEELQKDNRPALISVEQKVSATKKADHILIINRGQVAGYGTHDELATTSTVYQQILASQEVTA